MARMDSPRVRTFDGSQFDRETLTDLKDGQRISVCIPARNEEPTIGGIVGAIQDELVTSVGLVDEIIVVDDHSTDDTADVATAAGAKVIRASEVLSSHVTGHGKGEAMWRSLHASSGDLVVWCDADLVDFDAAFVVGLVGPLLTQSSVMFVKGCYERPIDDRPEGGGRVTELMARPALSLLFPELSAIDQPLAGECAGRREALMSVPFTRGYGVDIGLVIDIASSFGLESIAQVDLGIRRHRNRTYEELTPMATQVLAAVLSRAEALGSDAVDEMVLANLPPLSNFESSEF